MTALAPALPDPVLGSSFRWPITLVSDEKRRALKALYRFCKAADDVADAPSGLTLETLRDDLFALFHGEPTLPVVQALREPVRRFDLPEDLFQDILSGIAMDVNGPILRPSLEELELYCYRVASCVGLLVIGILGYRSPRVPACAVRQGHALQLTNILRDIAPDAAMGRIYLPKEALEAAGMGDCGPESLLGHPSLPQACAYVAELARAHYAAAAAMPREWSLLPAHWMRWSYHRKFRKIDASIARRAAGVPA